MERRNGYAVSLETKCDIMAAISLRNHCERVKILLIFLKLDKGNLEPK